MMIDEFYLDINLELLFKWIVGNKSKYDQTVKCQTGLIARYAKTINFEYHHLTGSIVIWTNGIVEETIVNEKQEQIFYLHYQLVNLNQGQKLFYEFYEALIKYRYHAPYQIILCCSGGLSSSFFAKQLTQLIALKHLNYQITPIGFYQLDRSYQNYDALYLAPQISYLLPNAMKIMENKIPVRTISPSIYATYNYRGLLDMITSENIIKNH